MPVRPLALVVPFLGVALSACSSITPIRVSLPKGESYTGTAWTNAYTGTFSAGPCQGSFNGPLERPDVIIAMHCVGRRGTGTGVRNGSTFVGGTVALNNGTIATISRAGPDPVYHLIPPLPPPDASRGATLAPSDPSVSEAVPVPSAGAAPTATSGPVPGFR
jgi:hypothetical protein